MKFSATQKLVWIAKALTWAQTTRSIKWEAVSIWSETNLPCTKAFLADMNMCLREKTEWNTSQHISAWWQQPVCCLPLRQLCQGSWGYTNTHSPKGIRVITHTDQHHAIVPHCVSVFSCSPGEVLYLSHLMEPQVCKASNSTVYRSLCKFFSTDISSSDVCIYQE